MQRRGICSAFARSPAVTVAHPVQAAPPPAVAVTHRIRACTPTPGPCPGPGRKCFRPHLPPARTEPHPALYLPASILALLTLARNSVSLLAPPLSPSPPDGDDNVVNQRSVDATMDPLPEDNRRQATQSASSLSPPPRKGGGHRTQRPVTPEITQPLGQVPPHGHPSSSVAGGIARGGGWRARRQHQKRQRRRC